MLNGESHNDKIVDMKNLPKGTKCKVTKTIKVIIDEDTIILYSDNLGDTIEIIQKEFDSFGEDPTYYLVKNLTKKYEQYIPSTILELI